MIEEIGVPLAVGVIAVLVFVVGARLRALVWRKPENGDSGSVTLELISTLFMAVAAFVVVICWQQFDNAHNHTVAESKSLVDVYSAAHAMPEPAHSEIQGLVREYTERVVTTEWAVMDRDRRLDQDTQDILDTLRDTVLAVESEDSEVTDQREIALASLDAVGQARHDRALDAQLGMPGFLYGALWFGTVLLLLSSVLAGVEVSARSVAMTALLGVVIGAAILAIYRLDRPFAGGNVVSKDAFELALARFQHIT
ncbi:bestrophin-like domain [Nocardia brasiliensis]